MGQSSSRSQRSASQNASASSTPSPRGAAAEASSSNSQPGPSSTPSSSQSRSSLRKKVVSMIKPSSHREKEDTRGERSKRRLSKSPVQVVEGAQQSEAGSSRRPASPALSNDKGKKRADVEELPEEPRLDTPPPPIVTASPPPPTPAPVSAPAPSPAPVPAPATPSRIIESDTQGTMSRSRSEGLGNRDEENTPSSANLNRNPVSPAPPQTNATPTRQFPPPGTLVVVQGIVHTADVSRPPSDRPSTGTEARGGAFTRSSPTSSLGRSSTDSSPPSTSETSPTSESSSRSSGISPGSVDVLGTLLSVAAAATAASLLTGSSEPILSSGLAPPGSGASSTNPGSPIAGDRPAATPGPEQDATFAASRAERMRQAWGTIRERLGLRPTPPPRPSSSGLGQNGFTAGGGFGGLGTGSGVTDTRELMLEEMARAFNIGLGLNGFGGTASPGGSTATGASQEGDIRARGTVPVDEEVSEDNAGSGTLPAEGSFDRFLVDLQSDLRVALSGDGEGEGSAEQRQPEQEVSGAPIPPSPEAVSISQPPPPSTTPPPLPSPASPPMVSFSSTIPPPDDEDSAQDAEDDDDDMPALENLHDSDSEMTGVQNTDRGEDGAPMSEEDRRLLFEDVARELGLGAQNAPQVDGDVTPRPSVPSPATERTGDGQPPADATTESTGAPASGPSSSTGSRNGRMDESGRINWWRLYRFPAINSTAPSPSTSSGTTSPASPSGAGATVAPTTPEPSNPTTSAQASGSQGPQQPATPAQPTPPTPTNPPAPTSTATPFLPSFLPPPAGQTVVPVIVVGLQSVAPGQLGFEVMPAHTHPHTHTHDHHAHNHIHNHGTPASAPASPPAAPPSVLPRTRQEELAVLEDMLREAEAEAEADAILYDSLERLARSVGADAAGEQRRRESWERLNSRDQSASSSQNRSRGQMVTVEEVEDEDAAGPSRPLLRRNVDDFIAEDEALDLEDADDEDEDSDEEKEEVDDDEEEEASNDDYYRRSDRNARARAMAKAEAKKEAREEKKRRKERREKARQARAARHAAAAEARANLAASASSSSGAGGSSGRNGYATRPTSSVPSPIGSERERGTSSTAWSRYAEQLRDLHSQMRDERRLGRHPPPASPFGTSTAPPLRPAAPGVGAGGMGMGMTMGGMSGPAGAGMALPGGPGSRTFLIYVIGGYYPPDHTIVTGGPESFQSFEALLELAEMLGHAKPPTVTKEEIDKSGLETIKPAQLAAYEESGKIASNCTERCLICLDDYAPEDDVRVMSCRHAFHQACVDTWLQTGRNNCPACRSTGVNAAEANATLA